MARRPPNLPTALSLLLGVATAVLWVRSHFVADSLFRRAGSVTTVCSSGGWIKAEQFVTTCGTWDAPAGVWTYARSNADARSRRLELVCSTDGWRLSAPYGLLGAIALLPAAMFMAGRHPIRLRRRRSGFCIRCGYDLRATPGRCPECGTPATTPA